jgi:hypothetical protein
MSRDRVDGCLETSLHFRRRYLGLDVLTRAQAVDTSGTQEVSDQLTLQAITPRTTTTKDQTSYTTSADLTGAPD